MCCSRTSSSSSKRAGANGRSPASSTSSKARWVGAQHRHSSPSNPADCHTQHRPYAHDFVAIREKYDLPRSTVFSRGIRRASSSQLVSPTPPTRRTSRPNIHTAASDMPPSPSRSQRTQRTPRTPAQPTPVPLGDDEEPPPPAYSRDDPEPSSTLLLHERLTAEADENERRLSTSLPGSTRPSVNLERPPTAGPSSASARPSAETPRPAEVPHAPVLEPEPDPDEMDDDVRRVWEESQLEEAKRASRAAEREREMLEQAVQLSLQEAEAQALRESESRNAEAGPSQSAALASTRYDESSLSIPGDWQISNASSNTTKQQSSLLDDLDPLNVSHAPLKPDATGSGVMRSNNPFLSSSEREELSAQEREAARQKHIGETTPASTYASPLSPTPLGHRRVSSNSKPLPHPPNDAASLATAQGIRFTTPQGFAPMSPSSSAPEICYDPPSEAPPAHLRVRTPPLPSRPNITTTVMPSDPMLSGLATQSSAAKRAGFPLGTTESAAGSPSITMAPSLASAESRELRVPG